MGKAPQGEGLRRFKTSNHLICYEGEYIAIDVFHLGPQAYLQFTIQKGIDSKSLSPYINISIKILKEKIYYAFPLQVREKLCPLRQMEHPHILKDKVNHEVNREVNHFSPFFLRSLPCDLCMFRFMIILSCGGEIVVIEVEQLLHGESKLESVLSKQNSISTTNKFSC